MPLPRPRPGPLAQRGELLRVQPQVGLRVPGIAPLSGLEQVPMVRAYLLKQAPGLEYHVLQGIGRVAAAASRPELPDELVCGNMPGMVHDEILQKGQHLSAGPADDLTVPDPRLLRIAAGKRSQQLEPYHIPVFRLRGRKALSITHSGPPLSSEGRSPRSVFISSCSRNLSYILSPWRLAATASSRREKEPRYFVLC